jgi:hypothetical protein
MKRETIIIILRSSGYYQRLKDSPDSPATIIRSSPTPRSQIETTNTLPTLIGVWEIGHHV